ARSVSRPRVRVGSVLRTVAWLRGVLKAGAAVAAGPVLVPRIPCAVRHLECRSQGSRSACAQPRMRRWLLRVAVFGAASQVPPACATAAVAPLALQPRHTPR